MSQSQQIDSDLLVLLYDVARMIRRRADHVAGKRGTTRAQWVVIGRLASRPGLSQAELAGLAEVEPITMARLLDRLESRGLVERRPDQKDRRLRRLFLTEKAQPLLEEVGAFRAEMNEVATRGLDPSALAGLRESLGRIKANLSDDKAARCEGAVSPPLETAPA